MVNTLFLDEEEAVGPPVAAVVVSLLHPEDSRCSENERNLSFSPVLMSESTVYSLADLQAANERDREA